MTHRERVLAALGHRAPDRVPRDLGGNSATTHDDQGSRAHAGVPGPADRAPAGDLLRRSSTVVPDEAMLQRFDVDARCLLLGAPDRRPDRRLSDDAFVDEWGVTWTRPEGGHFISTDGPFYKHEEPTVADLESFALPDAADPGSLPGARRSGPGAPRGDGLRGDPDQRVARYTSASSCAATPSGWRTS